MNSGDPVGEPSLSVHATRGQLFGRYNLLERIGTGGIAEIWRAERRSPPGRPIECAVKRLRRDKRKDARYVKMLMDEGRITSVLRHPNIVALHRYGNETGEPYLELERLDAIDLGRLLSDLKVRGDVLPWKVAAYVARQVACALHHAHTAVDPDGCSRSLIHRDVSPENIMLCRTGEVKLIDFGVARAHESLREPDTAAGEVKGKISYMAPECIKQQTFDHRADLFSLGVVLWESLTGRSLMGTGSLTEILAQLFHGVFPRPSSLVPSVPGDLDRLTAALIERNPADRLNSAAEIVASIDNAVPGVSEQAQALAELVRAVGTRPSESPKVQKDEEATTVVSLRAKSRRPVIVVSPQRSVPPAFLVKNDCGLDETAFVSKAGAPKVFEVGRPSLTRAPVAGYRPKQVPICTIAVAVTTAIVCLCSLSFAM